MLSNLKNKNIAVTVIVTVYNVSQYIEKCARSLFEQTLQSLEIIFVDDCSPDDSISKVENILNEYIDRKENTIIIRLKENLGQAGARSVGMHNARGKYVIHCDADDWVSKNLYKSMYETCLAEKADIVYCDFVYEERMNSILKPVQYSHINGKQLLENWYKEPIHMSCCNKLVKREIYERYDLYPWQGLNMWEDNGLLMRQFYYGEKIVKIKGEYFYYYNRQNENAVTIGYRLAHVEQMIGIAENLSKFFDTKPDKERYRKTINAIKYLAKINLVTDSFTNYRRFKTLFPESNLITSELNLNSFSKKGKIRFYMVKCGLAPVFIVLFKLRNILG